MQETRRNRTLSGKFTAEEEASVKEAAARLGIDLSSFVRRAVLHELSDGPIDASEAMLELFVRTMEASLELVDQFTGKHFRQLCAEVKAQSSATPGAARGEAEENAQA